MSANISVGIIGGSGMKENNIFTPEKLYTVRTPFGEPSDIITYGNFGGMKIYYIPRHGKNHTISPSLVNYRANLWALKQLGCTHVIGTTATSSLQDYVKPGDLLILTSFINRTTKREGSFYNGEPYIGHVPMQPSFCKKLGGILHHVAKPEIYTCHPKGTVVTVEGPRMPSLAESMLYHKWGADVVSMTTVPEVCLAKELALLYACIASITDYSYWSRQQPKLTTENVIDIFELNAVNVENMIQRALPLIAQANWEDDVRWLKKTVKRSTYKKLKPLTYAETEKTHFGTQDYSLESHTQDYSQHSNETYFYEPKNSPTTSVLTAKLFQPSAMEMSTNKLPHSNLNVSEAYTPTKAKLSVCPVVEQNMESNAILAPGRNCHSSTACNSPCHAVLCGSKVQLQSHSSDNQLNAFPSQVPLNSHPFHSCTHLSTIPPENYRCCVSCFWGKCHTCKPSDNYLPSSGDKWQQPTTNVSPENHPTPSLFRQHEYLPIHTPDEYQSNLPSDEDSISQQLPTKIPSNTSERIDKFLTLFPRSDIIQRSETFANPSSNAPSGLSSQLADQNPPNCNVPVQRCSVSGYPSESITRPNFIISSTNNLNAPTSEGKNSSH